MHFGEIERLLLSINMYVPRGKSDESLSNEKTVGITKKNGLRYNARMLNHILYCQLIPE